MDYDARVFRSHTVVPGNYGLNYVDYCSGFLRNDVLVSRLLRVAQLFIETTSL